MSATIRQVHVTFTVPDSERLPDSLTEDAIAELVRSYLVVCMAKLQGAYPWAFAIDPDVS